MGGTLNQPANLRSEIDAFKEQATKQQLGVGGSGSKVQAFNTDDACNVLCEKCPKKQNKNKRPKATARKCYNCDEVWHIDRECKFWRKDSHLRLPTNSKAGVQHKRHIKGDKWKKLPDDCCRQKHVENTVDSSRALHAPSEYETEVKCRLYSDDSVDFNTHLYKSDELNLMKTMYDHFNKVGSTLNNIKISLAEVVAGTKLSPKRA
ncbi:hypothetical protein GQX74_014677 [Glossina fuscipes]|nr:hypothetical protein GQX74_014677 [Glossina fuscipes]